MKNTQKKSIIAPLIMAVLGIVMIIYGVYASFLTVVGSDASAKIKSSTYFNKKGYPTNTYSYDVSYVFQVKGKEYTGSGYITKHMYGGPSGTIKIKYLSFAPGFNEPTVGISKEITGMLIAGFLLTILNIAIIRQERKQGNRTRCIKRNKKVADS